MKLKVFCLGVELAALGGATLFVFWWPFLGWLRQESFYQGQPTSYWEQELEQWSPSLLHGTSFHNLGGIYHTHHEWVRQGSTWGPGLAFVNPKTESVELPLPPVPLLSGDPEAEPVLTALLSSPNEMVRHLAQQGLEAIRRKTLQ
jgi:hypothetical protein